jgi:hypothetical protein
VYRRHAGFPAVMNVYTNTHAHTHTQTHTCTHGSSSSNWSGVGPAMGDCCSFEVIGFRLVVLAKFFTIFCYGARVTCLIQDFRFGGNE